MENVFFNNKLYLIAIKTYLIAFMTWKITKKIQDKE
jgi:hypothetical protein